MTNPTHSSSDAGTGTAPCPVTETISGYVLRCVFDAGHPGAHWASELEPVS